METLIKNKQMTTIQEVANETGENRIKLRDEQLQFIRNNVSRKSSKWDKLN